MKFKPRFCEIADLGDKKVATVALRTQSVQHFREWHVNKGATSTMYTSSPEILVAYPLHNSRMAESAGYPVFTLLTELT